MCVDPLPQTPLENHKSIEFVSNTGPGLWKNHKGTKPAFNHWADDGSLSVVLGPFSTNK